MIETFAPKMTQPGATVHVDPRLEALLATNLLDEEPEPPCASWSHGGPIAPSVPRSASPSSPAERRRAQLSTAEAAPRSRTTAEHRRCRTAYTRGLRIGSRGRLPAVSSCAPVLQDSCRFCPGDRVRPCVSSPAQIDQSQDSDHERDDGQQGDEQPDKPHQGFANPTRLGAGGRHWTPPDRRTKPGPPAPFDLAIPGLERYPGFGGGGRPTG